MSYGYVYVVSIVMGANKNQSLKYGNNNGSGQKRSGLFLSIHRINRDVISGFAGIYKLRSCDSTLI